VASIRSHIDVVKLLLNAGADIEAKNYVSEKYGIQVTPPITPECTTYHITLA